MIGAAGDDIYYLNAAYGGQIIEQANEGIDGVYLIGEWFDYTLPTNVENLLNAGAGTFVTTRTFIGNSLDNIINGVGVGGGLSQSNVIDGGAGADTMVGASKDDTYIVDNVGDVVIDRGFTLSGQDLSLDTVKSSISYVLGERIENLILTGNAAINGSGNARNNRLDGSQNSAANVLAGGLGDDYYVLGAGDVIVENAGEGMDTIEIGAPLVATYDIASLNPHIENLLLADAASASNLIGDARNNALTGNRYANTLDAGAGNDLLLAGEGNDTLIGGAGDDDLQGGQGSDTYVFDAGFGHDRIFDWSDMESTIGFGSGIRASEVGFEGIVEQTIYVTVAGSDDRIDIGILLPFLKGVAFDGGTVWDNAAIQARFATGNAASEAANTLSGTVSDDAILALGGDDFASGEEGNDWLDGADGNDRLFGNAGNDTLIGQAGNDTLTGGIGADVLIGGLGNDLYRFARGEGSDLIQDVDATIGNADMVQFTDIFSWEVSITRDGNDLLIAVGETDAVRLQSWFLGAQYQIEAVSFANFVTWEAGTLTSMTLPHGTPGDDVLLGGSGNDEFHGEEGDDLLDGAEGNDLLYGDAGNDTLIGGPGADSMFGGTGDDLYRIDGSDSISENANEGIDTVEAAISFTLGANFENLTLVGSAGIDGTGNSLANVLVGNDAANRLSGGTGNDIYYVGAGDTVVEASNGGTDSVFSSVSFTLSTNVENLTLTGSSNIDATGNTLGQHVGRQQRQQQTRWRNRARTSSAAAQAMIPMSSMRLAMSSPRTPTKAPTQSKAASPTRWVPTSSTSR